MTKEYVTKIERVKEIVKWEKRIESVEAVISIPGIPTRIKEDMKMLSTSYRNAINEILATLND